jgi:hypothetical protein
VPAGADGLKPLISGCRGKNYTTPGQCVSKLFSLDIVSLLVPEVVAVLNPSTSG